MLGALHQRGAVANQLVAATRARMMNRTGDGVDLAPLLGRQPGGDQRTARRAGLDHQHPKRQATDDAVAPREVARLGWAIQRQLGNQCAALFGDLPRQAFMATRIEALQAGAEYRDGPATCVQRDDPPRAKTKTAPESVVPRSSPCAPATM